MNHVPFNRPICVGREQEYITEAVTSNTISGDGPFARRASGLLEQTMGARKVLLTTSCTHALEMAALLLDLGPGDEVIMPSYTFVSTANAVVLRGARPVFIDIRPDTLNMDELRVAEALTPRTRAIFVVHYAGVACEMDTIVRIAANRRIPIIEDNAHGLYATYKGRQLGTIGTFATQSFHETKNFTCGEGGALVINDDGLIERAEIIREKGTNRSKFFRGQIDKYSWVAAGSSYLPSEISAAFLLGQLERRERIQPGRQRAWAAYANELAQWAELEGIRLPAVPDHCKHSAHLFYLVMPTLEARTKFIGFLKSQAVNAAFHYVPLHDSSMGRELGYRRGDLPITEDLADRVVRLPMFNLMSDETINRVIEACKSYSTKGVLA